ncbi:hypothetical protein Ocin01_18173 [Orchesella cincta]|uniref:Uncharacterized protein n=1 Tax=Orchesella cincta TaxID=48709 RepID=A0A1D2M6B3_ORCCI|nr:hypothetical protein Ocin01_18173 [Orchesella cincta]
MKLSNRERKCKLLGTYQGLEKLQCHAKCQNSNEGCDMLEPPANSTNVALLQKIPSLTQKRPSDNQAQQPLYKTTSEVGTRQASTSTSVIQGCGPRTRKLKHSTEDAISFAPSVNSHDSRSDLIAAGIELKDVKTEALRNFKNVDNNTLLRVVKELKECKGSGKWLKVINRMPLTAHLIQMLLPDTV